VPPAARFAAACIAAVSSVTPFPVPLATTYRPPPESSWLFGLNWEKAGVAIKTESAVGRTKFFNTLETALYHARMFWPSSRRVYGLSGGWTISRFRGGRDSSCSWAHRDDAFHVLVQRCRLSAKLSEDRNSIPDSDRNPSSGVARAILQGVALQKPRLSSPAYRGRPACGECSGAIPNGAT
jgi:hypothetical protein